MDVVINRMKNFLDHLAGDAGQAEASHPFAEKEMAAAALLVEAANLDSSTCPLDRS